MSSFKDTKQTEAESRTLLEPVFTELFNPFVYLDHETHTYELQKFGDVFATARINGKNWLLDIKAEEANRHGNFYLESFSNRSAGRLGWMYTSQCDYIVYVFLSERAVYFIELKRLRDWAFKGSRKIWDRYPERAQSKHVQSNNTYGWCARIEDVRKEVNFAKELIVPELAEV